MSLLKAFLKIINAVNDWVGNLLSYFLFLFFALLFMEVILRYFFNSPTVWANELAQMLFGAYAILAGGYILRTGGHVNVDILYSHLSKKSKAGLDIFTSILFFLFWVSSAISMSTFKKMKISRMSLARPCSISNRAARGIINLAGYRGGFQADWECSKRDKESQAREPP